MRCALTALGLAFVATAAVASPATYKATERKVVATAKRMSASNCQPRAVGKLHLSGCGYAAFFSADQWSVVVTAGYIGEHGEFYHGGAIGVYYFTSSGKFIKMVPGM